MKQLFYAPDIASAPFLPEEESQHCARVLRLKAGDEITVADGKGIFYAALLDEVSPKRCRVTLTGHQEQKRGWNGRIHIAVAPTKNLDRMEWMTEKATEIGVDAITFLRCRHSERQEIKLSRLRKIAVSAMKQSQKATLPQINEMTDFAAFVSYPFDGRRMIAHCDDGDRRLIRDVCPPGSQALILIGPEGDFSKDEIEYALAQGFAAVSLGESRLRTETAALVACHTWHVLSIMN